MDDTILFFGEDKEWGEFSNFYPLEVPILYEGKPYQTSEHLYQSLKFLHDKSTKYDLQYAELIRTAKTPYMAKLLAGQKQKNAPWAKVINRNISKYKNLARLRPDWDSVKEDLMYQVLQLKFHANDHCKQVLMSTSPKPIAENSPFDYIWGLGKTGKGQNLLGKLLVKLRDTEFGEPKDVTVVGPTEDEPQVIRATFTMTAKELSNLFDPNGKPWYW
jgi:ribA/ribD-fused uncharacterized protein